MEGEEVVLDSPVEEQDSAVAIEPEVEAPEVSTESEPEQQQESEALGGDGRTLPRDVQKALKALRENPDTAGVARTLNDYFFRGQRLEKEFPPSVGTDGRRISSIDQAVAAKRALEVIGGEEGISKLQEQVSLMEAVDQDIAKGDPGFIKDIVSEFPDGFKKLVPHVMSELYNLDRAAYGQVVAPIIYNTLMNAGLFTAAGEVVPEKAKELLADVQHMIRNAPKEDPKAAEYNAREQELNQREEKSFMESVGTAVNTHRNALVMKTLTPILKANPLQDGARKRLVEAIYKDIDTEFRNDANYQRNLKSLLKTRDSGRTSNYLKSELDNRVARIVQSVYKDLYGTKPKTAKPAAQAQATVAGKLTNPPKLADLDKVPGYQTLYIAHKGFLKGKPVSW